jgi:AcrR family transcriptional regulator
MSVTVKPRRKPSQSRAWMTSGAIQDAFAMLLAEQGYDKVSMREIAAVAGVGLGTLYLYFPNKGSIAAVTVRTRLRKLAADLAVVAGQHAGSPLQRTIHALVATHVAALTSQPAAWRALLYLERRISSPDSYREIYDEYVRVYRDAMAASCDWPGAIDTDRVAFNAFTIIEALSKRALMVRGGAPAAAELASDIEGAVLGYLRSLPGLQPASAVRTRPCRRA